MSDVLAITGGTVIDVRTGVQHPNTTVLIDGERIASIGTAVPENAQVLDASGAWLLPGLMDMHAHTTGGAHRERIHHLYLAYGVTTVRDTGGNLTLLRLLRERIEQGSQLGLQVTGHVPRTITMTRAIQLGMDCLEHIRITGRDLLPPAEAERLDPLPVARRETLLWERFELDSEPMQRLIKLVADSRVFFDPTLLVDSALSLDGYAIDTEHPANADVPGDVREAFVREEQPSIFDSSQVSMETARNGFRKRQRLVRGLHEAGARLLAGTDCFGLGKQLPGLGLQNELALLVESGLSPLAALQAATVTAAEALGQSEALGALEPGKFADIVVVEADPLADIQNARRVRTVIKAGQVYHAQALRQEGR